MRAVAEIKNDALCICLLNIFRVYVVHSLLICYHYDQYLSIIKKYFCQKDQYLLLLLAILLSKC